MSFFLAGNVPYNSTFASASNPSTGTLLAELDSSNFQISATAPLRERMYSVMAYLGGSTGGAWVVESATSTALNATVDAFNLRTASGQTSQFVLHFRLTAPTDRIRVRHTSTATGSFEAKLSAQEIS